MKDNSLEPPEVACVIVNYRSPWEMIRDCLKSVVETNAEVPCRIVLVDNASGDGVTGRVLAEFPSVQIIEMTGNAGFATAVNRGLDELDEPFVLMLNTDAMLEKSSLAEMTKALKAAGDDVAGIAPKMVSSSMGGVLDAIGIVVPPSGAAFNRGIGQCDLGQYDTVEEVAGACFGACLLRRELFSRDKVGSLYEGYFLYFEDSDWCVRAVSQGYRFLTAPGAVVRHLHSGVTRNASLGFKYGLIELNTLKMVTRTMESPLRVAKIVSSRCLRLLARTFIRRKFIGPNSRTMASYLAALPQLLRERGQLKDKRTVPDSRIFAMARDERAYFDTVAYRPDRCIESLIDTYLRLLSKDQDPETGKVLAALYRLDRQASGPDPGGLTNTAMRLQLDPETASLFSKQPACVQDLLRSAGAVSTR